MNSIKEVATTLINEKKDFISFDEVISKLDAKDIPTEELKVIIYTDLTTNGEFFFKDGLFNLKKNFTMYEISRLKSEYAISEIEEDIKEDEEIIDKNYEENEIDMDIDIDNIIDTNIDLEDTVND